MMIGKEELNPNTPVAPVDMRNGPLRALLGLFGNEDCAPSPRQVKQL
jgi:hypothetical protein